MKIEEMNEEQIAIYRQIRDKRWELYKARTRKKHERDQWFKDMALGTIVALGCINDWDYTIDKIVEAIGW